MLSALSSVIALISKIFLYYFCQIVFQFLFVFVLVNIDKYFNRTEWSPIRSVIIRVITKSDDRAAGVRFVYHEYDYGRNWTTRSPIIN